MPRKFPELADPTHPIWEELRLLLPSLDSRRFPLLYAFGTELERHEVESDFDQDEGPGPGPGDSATPTPQPSRGSTPGSATGLVRSEDQDSDMDILCRFPNHASIERPGEPPNTGTCTCTRPPACNPSVHTPRSTLHDDNHNLNAGTLGCSDLIRSTLSSTSTSPIPFSCVPRCPVEQMGNIARRTSTAAATLSRNVSSRGVSGAPRVPPSSSSRESTPGSTITTTCVGSEDEASESVIATIGLKKHHARKKRLMSKVLGKRVRASSTSSTSSTTSGDMSDMSGLSSQPQLPTNPPPKARQTSRTSRRKLRKTGTGNGGDAGGNGGDGGDGGDGPIDAQPDDCQRNGGRWAMTQARQEVELVSQIRTLATSNENENAPIWEQVEAPVPVTSYAGRMLNKLLEVLQPGFQPVLDHFLSALKSHIGTSLSAVGDEPELSTGNTIASSSWQIQNHKAHSKVHEFLVVLGQIQLVIHLDRLAVYPSSISCNFTHPPPFSRQKSRSKNAQPKPTQREMAKEAGTTEKTLRNWLKCGHKWWAMMCSGNVAVVLAAILLDVRIDVERNFGIPDVNGFTGLMRTAWESHPQYSGLIGKLVSELVQIQAKLQDVLPEKFTFYYHVQETFRECPVEHELSLWKLKELDNHYALAGTNDYQLLPRSELWTTTNPQTLLSTVAPTTPLSPPYVPTTTSITGTAAQDSELLATPPSNVLDPSVGDGIQSSTHKMVLDVELDVLVQKKDKFPLKKRAEWTAKQRGLASDAKPIQHSESGALAKARSFSPQLAVDPAA
ncbi:hypothetical protein BDN72DRAFT_905062 [Pluteus cervinus]|uniref:Uncharacterized protein n=1 Tax=Pluteus cervinus TaxID=181527 RepID=A0ACD3A3T0_9AGAR|nr:hypothetical protein BDN72DRAFT_905062 [Pluteus cervinus]